MNRFVPCVCRVAVTAICVTAALRAEGPQPARDPSQVIKIIDNGTDGFAAAGKWLTADLARVHGKDVLYNEAPGGVAETAAWTFTKLSAGKYRVSVSWMWRSNLATNALFTVYDGDLPIGSIRVNQKAGPKDFLLDGVNWADLGSFKVSSGILKVILDTAEADGYVLADAVRIEQFEGDSPPAPVSIGEAIASSAPKSAPLAPIPPRAARSIMPEPPVDPTTGLQGVPAGAIRVTTVAELHEALKTVKDYAGWVATDAHGVYRGDNGECDPQRVICCAKGTYDIGPLTQGQPLVLTNIWFRYLGDGRDHLTLLGGYDPVTWTRPATPGPSLPPATWCEYDPATGKTVLPERLRAFLADPTRETVFCSSVPTVEVLSMRNCLFDGLLDRITIVSCRDTRLTQPRCFDFPTTGFGITTKGRFKDVMMIMRYSQGHAYMGSGGFVGSGTILDKAIIYFPFCGNTGNARPQPIFGGQTVITPADHLFTSTNCCFIGPYTGGYSRIPDVMGGHFVFTRCQFISPKYASWPGSAWAGNIGPIDASGHSTREALVRFDGCQLVCGQLGGGYPWHCREFQFADTEWCVKTGFRAAAENNLEGLYAEQLSIENCRVFLEEGSALPAGQRLSRRAGGAWRPNGTTLGYDYIPPSSAPSSGLQPAAFSLDMQEIRRPWRQPDYLQNVTREMIEQAFAERGEAAAPYLFDIEHPAMKEVP